MAIIAARLGIRTGCEKMNFLEMSNERLAVEYAGVLYDLICCDDYLQRKNLLMTKDILAASIVFRFLSSQNFFFNDCGYFQKMPPDRRAKESEEENADKSKNGSTCQGADAGI